MSTESQETPKTEEKCDHLLGHLPNGQFVFSSDLGKDFVKKWLWKSALGFRFCPRCGMELIPDYHVIEQKQA